MPDPDAPNTLYRFGPTTDDPALHWYTYHWNGTVGAERVGDKIVIHYKDGELGDNDLTADGKIVDPVVPAFDAWPHHNRFNALDVDGDTHVIPLDVLLTINDINRNGSRSLDPRSLVFSYPHFYVDTNNDGFATPIDVLLVVNFINQQPAAEGEPPHQQPGLLAALPIEPLAVGSAEPSSESCPLDAMPRRESVPPTLAAPNDSHSTPSNNLPSEHDVHDRAVMSFLRESSMVRNKTTSARVAALPNARTGGNTITDREAEDLLFAQEPGEWLPSITDWRILRR